MSNIGFKYVPKDLSNEQMANVEKIKGMIQEMISTCTCFDDKRKAIYKGIDMLFRYVSTTKQYEKGDRKAKNFEAEEFDVDSFGDISSYTDKNIDKIIDELGFGSKSTDHIQIEREYMKNVGDDIDYSALEKLAKRTLSTSLDKEQLEFMKKTQFLSEFFKSQKMSKDNQANIENLSSTVKLAKSQLNANDNIDTKAQIMINGASVSSIAADYIKTLVENSYKKALKDENYAPILPSQDPSMSIVCGLPGLGKSSIFINDLKKQGYLCVDLDDIAISLSKKFNVPINEQTSGDIYTLANYVHDTVVAESMANGFDIAIEKIGYDKKQITSISDNMMSINSQVSQKTGNEHQYGQSLLMAAGSSVVSAEANSLRNAEQIFSGSDLRAYHYADLIKNNNCTTFAYLAVLSDENLRSRFSQIRISDRIGAFDGLCMADGKYLTAEKAKVKQLVKKDEPYECR